jgi:hypothetical protein
MTYACPVWKFAAESHLSKLQRLQNKVLRTIGNFPRHPSVRDMHEAFQIPYVYDYITKSRRQQAEVIQNHFLIPFYLQAVQIYLANGVKLREA